MQYSVLYCTASRCTVIVQDEIYALLKDPNHVEHQLRPSDLGTIYHHFDAARECRGHDTYSVNYTPSFVTPVTPP